MKTIITTTGISLYYYTRTELSKAHPEATTIEPTDEQMRHCLYQSTARASAEVNSLEKMANKEDYLVFLTTDTSLAQRCINLLMNYFRREGYTHVFSKKLLFQDKEEHIETLGIRNLISVLASEISTAQKQNHEVIINATSGYKVQAVYSTLLGMLYQVPVKYIHEEFKNVITFNPLALEVNLSIFVNYRHFFEWIEDEQYSHYHNEVEEKLKTMIYDEDDRARVRSFLEPADVNGEVFLSPMAFTLFRRADEYSAQTPDVLWPPASNMTDIDQKIAASIVEHKHHYPNDMLDICQKIAELEYVKFVYGEWFANTTSKRMGTFSADGTVRLRWADKDHSARLTILTTADNMPQTIKVRNYIQELLKIP